MPKSQVAASVQALFPPSATKNVVIQAAWRAEDDPSGRLRPAPNGPDGWTTMGRLATAAELRFLASKGYTWVNLVTGGTANNMKDAEIATLI